MILRQPLGDLCFRAFNQRYHEIMLYKLSRDKNVQQTVNSKDPDWLKDRAHLSTFKFFILEKFSCIVVLIVFFVIVQSSGLTYVWFREKTTFFLNFISFHIFAIYVGGACWGLPAACGLIAVSGARLPSVDGLTVRYIKNAPLLNMPSKYVCDLFQTCFRYMYVWYKHTGTLPLCLTVALSFIWLD